MSEADSPATVHAYVVGEEGSAQEASTSVNNEDDSYEVTLTAPDTSGDYTVNVYVDATQSSLDREASASATTEFSVDADEPLVEATSPEADSVVNDDEQTIEFDVQDNQTAAVSSANEDLELVVDLVSDTTSETYVVDPVDGANTEGLSYDAGTLTISPGTGDVPALDEGPVTATVNATDEAGNYNETSLNFDVASETPTFDISEVEPIGQTKDANQTFTVDINSPNVALNDSESTLTVTGPNGDGYELTEENSSYTTPGFDGATASFVIDSDDDLPTFGEDGTYTVTVSAENDAGTSNSTSETFVVNTDSPNVSSITTTFDDVVNENFDDETVTVSFDQEVQKTPSGLTLKPTGRDRTPSTTAILCPKRRVPPSRSPLTRTPISEALARSTTRKRS